MSDETEFPQSLTEVMEELWALRRPGPKNLYESREFRRLKSVCDANYPGAIDGMGSSSGLGNALRSLGVPCWSRHGNSLSAGEAARRLDAAFRDDRTLRVHMVPLEGCHDLELEFGRSKVGCMEAAQLKCYAEAARIERLNSGPKLDWSRLAMFHWLVVEEDVAGIKRPSSSAMPFLEEGFDQDFGRIEPYESRLPPPVEEALFFLLLAPWETWLQSVEGGWRPFRPARVYTADRDLFVHLARPIADDELDWEPEIYTDYNGEPVEVDVPRRNRNLTGEAEAVSKILTDDWWKTHRAALSGSLFQTPVAHFLVRGFLSDGIDEFIAHLATIESALGTEVDYRKDLIPQGAPHRGARATRRMEARVSALLDDAGAGREYSTLFDMRSTFIHGRRLTAISSGDRVRARALARKVVNGLIAASAAGRAEGGREQFLTVLLDIGMKMTTVA